MKRGRGDGDKSRHDFVIDAGDAEDDDSDPEDDVLQAASADQTVNLGDGVRMRAELDPFAGGLAWFPLGEGEQDPAQRQHLRLY